MAFFRFSRDKRGYEHFYLVEPVTNRRGKTRPRVLYWYRTQPNIKVGRPPFDEDVRRALEAQNPSVSFDWPKIVSAPIPSADVDKWRERRRVERAEKAARHQRAARTDDGTPIDGREDAVEGAPAEAGPAAPVSGLGTREQPYHVTSDQIRKRKRRRRGRGRSGDPNAAAIAAPDAAAAEPVDTAAPSARQQAGPEDTGAPLEAQPTEPSDTPGE